MPANITATVESFAPVDAVREPVFENRNGRLDWETDVNDADEYHDAQEFVPLKEQDVPLRPDAAITTAELHALAADATAHGEIPGVNTDDENDDTTTDDENNDTPDDGPTDTEAPSDDGKPKILGVQDAIPGVQDANPGVQDAIPGVQENNTEEEEEEEEIVFETDSEYEPSVNTSHLTSEDDSTEEHEDSSQDSTGSDEERRIQTTTRSGRGIRIERHVYDNYQFVGTTIPRMHTSQACKLHLETTLKRIMPGGKSMTRSSSTPLPNTL
jgi:hypothetical protein